ncbi:MAG: serine hydrolase [Bacteroidota bacterium]
MNVFKKFKYQLSPVLILLLALSTMAQENKGFTTEFREGIHANFNYPAKFWMNGGDTTRYVFLNMVEFWPHVLFERTQKTKRLPINLLEDVSEFDVNGITLNNYITSKPVDGMIVIHNGSIVFEKYPRMLSNEKHLIASVSKPFVSTIIGILEDRGKIDVSNPISKYISELQETVWDSVKVIDALNMSSGIDCMTSIPAYYYDDGSCFYDYLMSIGWPVREVVRNDLIEFYSTLSFKRPPGAAFEYSNINTTILSLIIERITNKSIHESIEEEIWQKMGPENDGLLFMGNGGRSCAFGGFSMTLRDLARFGLLFTNSEMNKTNAVIPASYYQNIQMLHNPNLTTKSRFSDELKFNSYQWDEIYEDHDFYKSGFGGQGLYISSNKNLVIAFFGTMNMDKSGHELPIISRQLSNSGLFD